MSTGTDYAVFANLVLTLIFCYRQRLASWIKNISFMFRQGPASYRDGGVTRSVASTVAGSLQNSFIFSRNTYHEHFQPPSTMSARDGFTGEALFSQGRSSLSTLPRCVMYDWTHVFRILLYVRRCHLSSRVHRLCSRSGSYQRWHVRSWLRHLQVDLSTRVSKNISIRTPLVSSPMDTGELHIPCIECRL